MQEHLRHFYSVLFPTQTRAHIQGLEAPELTERIPRIEPKRTQEYSAVFCISLLSGFHRNLQV